MAKTASKTKETTATGTKARRAPQVKVKKESRAVTKLVEPGSQEDCTYCNERVKFQAKMRHQQVICNVYEKKKWVRVEHFHAECYTKAKHPFGDPRPID